ncbi:DUF2971 domain-containing protein [Roseateles sp. SL47]|uniref:DUF2971 domain-containing protein n=1 Tax=Roseateles sp. SL47 TaxID=2995138 RepID=UPI00226DAFC0|nr:DUF2971 domain-containing protein [Roseateles sp. SL47]WAC75385.1 DUF2971 domain-containing protein [Roseateles sp. SL47]
MAVSYVMYQYRPDGCDGNRDRDLEALVASTVWSSKREYLNDPFEFAALLGQDRFPDLVARASDVGITCFSRAKTNPLLWSHYANAHKGFAIGWDMSHAFFGRVNGMAASIILDVLYEDVPPDPSSFCDEGSYLKAALTTKPTVWSYEQEVRLIAERGGRRHVIPKEAIKQVLFGMAMTEQRMVEIRSHVRAAGICPEFARMERRAGSYGVVPVQL